MVYSYRAFHYELTFANFYLFLLPIQYLKYQITALHYFERQFIIYFELQVFIPNCFGLR